MNIVNTLKNIAKKVTNMLGEAKDYTDEVDSYSLSYRRTITGDESIDDITDTGIYYIGGTPPSGISTTYSYSFVYVTKNADYITQMIVEPRGGYVLCREKSGSPASWSGWKWLDCIVSSGTSGSFHWEKYSSGKARLWGYYSAGSVAMTSSYGNVYFRGSANSFSIPSGLFSSTPNINALVGYASSGIIGVSANGINTATCSFYIWSARSETKTVYVYAELEGYWS